MELIQVLFQNKDFIAVSKPSGISVHNNEDPQNLLLVLEKQLKATKLFPVHRLDKETSGVQILALNSESAAKLSEDFQSRSVKKIYCGVLRGQLKTQEGLWNRPLTDKAEGRKNPEGAARDRVPCETKFKALQSNKYFTLCEFDLITGRQHQIRKHTAIINHHLVGDPRYGDIKYNQKMADFYKTNRMYLHCLQIQIQGQTIECSMPSEFKKLFI